VRCSPSREGQIRAGIRHAVACSPPTWPAWPPLPRDYHIDHPAPSRHLPPYAPSRIGMDATRVRLLLSEGARRPVRTAPAACTGDRAGPSGPAGPAGPGPPGGPPVPGQPQRCCIVVVSSRSGINRMLQVAWPAQRRRGLTGCSSATPQDHRDVASPWLPGPPGRTGRHREHHGHHPSRTPALTAEEPHSTQKSHSSATTCTL
jgi:hypothetical protein